MSEQKTQLLTNLAERAALLLITIVLGVYGYQVNRYDSNFQQLDDDYKAVVKRMTEIELTKADRYDMKEFQDTFINKFDQMNLILEKRRVEDKEAMERLLLRTKEDMKEIIELTIKANAKEK